MIVTNCDFSRKGKTQLNARPEIEGLAFFYCSPGQIRQYFPREVYLRLVSREEIAFVMERLNRELQKTLAFMKPYDIFEK